MILKTIWMGARMPRERTLIIIGIVVAIAVFLLGYIIEGQVSSMSAVLAIFSFLITLYIDIRLDIGDILFELKSRRAVEGIHSIFVRDVALNEVRKRDSIFNDIAQGRVYFDSVGSMMQVYYELLRNPGVKKIRATSMVSVNVVWESERGRKTLEENLEAVQRGVSIERIFIFPDEATRDRSGDHLRKQAEGGIAVRTVLSRDLDAANRRDFMVTDSGVLLDYSIGPDGDIVECMVSANRQDLQKYDGIYAQIKSASSEG